MTDTTAGAATNLTDLLPQAAIRLGVSAADWRAAITAAGELLVEAGVAGESYTAAMIDVVDKHGPYIVIAPGFALAHARADESVRRTGMALIRLATPVAFGHETNDPVFLVAALAATDNKAHRQALAALARALSNPQRRAALDKAASAEEVLAALAAPAAPAHGSGEKARAVASASETRKPRDVPSDAVPSKGLVLTVCGNGLGTSLFLKNTADQVLDRWGWGPYLQVEATDTISAKGRAKEADFLLTSGAIASTLGDVGVAVEVIDDFTSQAEVEAALRRRYAI